MLIFNKQFRQEEKLISRTVDKIKKSKSIKMKFGKVSTDIGTTETYMLDDIDVCFNLGVKGGPNSIIIKEKNGNVIYTMDCHFDIYDKMQRARANWFHWLLNKTRDIYNKKPKKAEKLKKATQRVETQKEEKQQQQTVEQTRDSAIKEALSKLR